MKLDAELLEKARQIRLLIFGSVWYRFALALMGFGVLLLGGSEYVEDLITYTLNQFETYRDFKPGTRGIDVFSQVVGAGMIVFSVLLFIYFYNNDIKRKSYLIKLEIVRALEEGESFTEMQQKWLDQNPEKSNEMYTVLRDRELSIPEQHKYLRTGWTRK